MEKVSVVIPVYGNWNLLKRNIDSLIKFEKENILEIIAVDDCSPVENLYQFDANLVTIVKNESNLGYTGTTNNGLKRAKSDIVLLLDSDAYLLSPIINSLYNWFATDKLLGCIGFASVNEQGVTTGSFQYQPTLAGYVLGQKLESKFESIINGRNAPILPFSCCVAFRKECLIDVGYFDEKTFPVLEADNDLGMRILKTRWKILFDSKIIVCHQGGNSYKINSKRVRLYYKAKWNLLQKHKLIKRKRLIKGLIISRIKIEILAIKVLQLVYKKNETNIDKLDGRRFLIEDIKSY